MRSSARRAHSPEPALWMLGAVVSIATTTVAGREVTHELSVFQFLCTANAFCVLVLIPRLALAKENLWRIRRPATHVLRAAVHFSAQSAWLSGVRWLPLAQVVALEFTAPFWAAGLAARFLRERLRGVQVAAIVLGFAGILIILRPGVVAIQPAALAVLYSGIAYGATYVFTRTLSATEHPLSILFWMNVIQFPIALALALPDLAMPSPAIWPWLLVAGLSTLSTHYCQARAFALADTAVVVAVDFARVPLTMLAGYLLYAEPVDLFLLLGTAVILLGNSLNLVRRSPPATRRTAALR